MTEFDNLKRNYISAVQCSLMARASYNESKRWNEISHKFCEILVDNSNCPDKTAKKYELALIKEALSEEIESFYKK